LRLLIDSSIWSPVIGDLRRAGHDVEAVRDWPSDPGDLAILRYAHRERRILVTLDKDFGDLIVRDGEPHSGLLRIVAKSVRDQLPMILDAFDRHAADLAAEAIVTVEEDRIRVRPRDARP
jgi:predicted nuclease of predicted toxin-antitoxin system